jgi:hypothetical protein
VSASLWDGVRVAFIIENGAPIEFLEFTDPNHPARYDAASSPNRSD